ncbi:hypothetical protein [Rhizomonospora bruguierae]|uniref:hypothetical protein n=1 Tax=Rhizomonospora bruguierae TaxID=1581705 RepID=UPI001BD03423|nr:hypothetical protein [Micromonospora sp. NBRC 107566]
MSAPTGPVVITLLGGPRDGEEWKLSELRERYLFPVMRAMPFVPDPGEREA